MKLLKKLLKKKQNQDVLIYDENMLNSEVVPKKEPRIEDAMNMNPEGEYLLTENGIIVCSIVCEQKPKEVVKKEL